MYKFLIAMVAALSISQNAYSLTSNQLEALKEAVKEMCVFPDRKGDIIRAEGSIKAGTAVPIKLLRGDLSGKLQYEAWQGIPITLDKYKTDPRQCAVEIMKLLLPAFANAATTKSNLTAYRLGVASAWISHWRTEKSSETPPSDVAGLVAQHESQLTSLASTLGLSNPNSILNFDFNSRILGNYQDSSAVRTLSQLIEAKAGPQAAEAYKLGVAVEGTLWQAMQNRFSMDETLGPIIAEGTLSELNDRASSLGAAKVATSPFSPADERALNEQMIYFSQRFHENIETALRAD